MGNTVCQIPFAPDYIRKVQKREDYREEAQVDEMLNTGRWPTAAKSLLKNRSSPPLEGLRSQAENTPSTLRTTTITTMTPMM